MSTTVKLTKERLKSLIEDELVMMKKKPKLTKFQKDLKDNTFPGYDELKSLSHGITEQISSILDEEFVLNEGETTKCFNSHQLQTFKQKIIDGIWKGISTYNRAEKGDI